jgi:hypothetical protein
MLLEEPFRLAAGDRDACYYPAHVPIKDRAAPGLCFELAEGAPWRWVGRGGPVGVELADVLAAATLASLAGCEAWDGGGLHGGGVLDASPGARAVILAAHGLALSAALRSGRVDLAERLGREQQAVLDTVDEWQLGALMEPPVRYRTIKNYKLNTPKRVPPPVQVVGRRQTVWLWARAQATAWIAARPGVAWRGGLSDAEIQASGRRLPGRPRR